MTTKSFPPPHHLPHHSPSPTPLSLFDPSQPWRFSPPPPVILLTPTDLSPSSLLLSHLLSLPSPFPLPRPPVPPSRSPIAPPRPPVLHCPLLPSVSTGAGFRHGGVFSVRLDMFSLGVLVLEILSGQRNGAMYLQGHQHTLIKEAWQLSNEDMAAEFMDDSLASSYAKDQACIYLECCSTTGKTGDGTSVTIELGYPIKHH